MSRAWMSSSVQCRAHLDPSPQAHSPRSLCLCLSLTPAPDSPVPLALQVPTCFPRKELCSREPLRGTEVLSRARGHGPQMPLSLLTPLYPPCQMANPLSGTTLHLPPTRSGHSLGGLRQRRGSSSGSDGPLAGLPLITTACQCQPCQGICCAPSTLLAHISSTVRV